MTPAEKIELRGRLMIACPDSALLHKLIAGKDPKVAARLPGSTTSSETVSRELVRLLLNMGRDPGPFVEDLIVQSENL